MYLSRTRFKLFIGEFKKKVNCYTDMVFLYNVASYRSKEGLYLFWEVNPTQQKKSPLKKYPEVTEILGYRHTHRHHVTFIKLVEKHEH